MTRYNLVSLVGIPLLIGLGWLMSSDRRRMNWRAIIWGVVLQFAFGAVLFLMPFGMKVFAFMNDAVVRLLDCAGKGTYFVFGPLAIPPGRVSPAGEPSLGFFLAFQAFPTIVFFSALMAILYYWRVMPLIIRCFSWVFARLMRVSGAESLCAASNIFVGIESATTVRPYIERMTRSELFVMLTAGMSTVASNVLAFYTYCLQDTFWGIAGHLISASVLSAPAAIVMAKVMVPETGEPVTMGRVPEDASERDKSLFEAVINGATAGMRLIFGIIALLLAVLGLMAVVDLVLCSAGARINMMMGWHMDWSLSGLLAWVFYIPTALMGVQPEDIGAVARLLGERVIGTEVASYRDLALMLSQGTFVHARSAVIASYALCGFAHVASVAIFVGGIAALAPSRSGELARLGFKALIAATIACMLTACVAGVFLSGISPLLGIGVRP